LPFASSCRPILDQTVILLQGTSTPPVHAHAGRTKQMHSDDEKRRRSFVALHFAAGDLRR